MNKQSQTTFSANDIEETQPAMKIGLLVTVTPDGLPHVTLLSSLMAVNPRSCVSGSSPKGCRKNTFWDNRKVGFLIMSMNKELWSGKATYTHFSKDGPEYEYYNSIPCSATTLTLGCIPCICWTWSRNPAKFPCL